MEISMEKVWLAHYPQGVVHDINLAQYSSLTQLLNQSFKANSQSPFSVCMDRWMSYGELDNCLKL